MTPEDIVQQLCQLERNRVTGWKGPVGAAYNAISEDLHGIGVLDDSWQLTELGLSVLAILEKE